MATPDKVRQLQLLQQNFQTVLAQKQQFQNQISEIESVLTELKKTEKAYQIVGKVMIAKSKEEIAKDLEQKKENLQVRLKNFSSQEEKIQQILENTQKEALEELKKKRK